MSEFIKEQYKTIEEWSECNEIFPIGSMLYIKGSDRIYIADGKKAFNDLTENYVIDGIENALIKYLKLK